MSEWEEAKSRLGYRSKAMLTSSADKWDQQTGADIRAALERDAEWALKYDKLSALAVKRGAMVDSLRQRYDSGYEIGADSDQKAIRESIARAEAAEAEVSRLRAEMLHDEENETRIVTALEAEVERLREAQHQAVIGWDAEREKSERLRAALAALLAAWDRAEGGRGCYSCAEAHDCRCDLDRKISEVCTCGRAELETAADAARTALAPEVKP
jgi:hypothetical protein